ncbi:hypothetical protein [Azospirillum sp. TSA6c]|uniref:hypothetical protein n=1 Tax=Azospirillum sp. TSA6c TaxID=709813 RepID=UPI0011B85D9B|nr:hypothetical protein [Azospirillum sp. TSA6c]
MRDQRTQAPRVRVGAHGAVRKPDGRTAYPRIVQYEVEGVLHDLPPADGRVYFVKVHDLAAYNRLNQTGALGIGHRLPAAVPAVDNRVAPRA